MEKNMENKSLNNLKNNLLQLILNVSVNLN